MKIETNAINRISLGIGVSNKDINRLDEVILEERFINRETQQLNKFEAKELFKSRRNLEQEWGLDEVINTCDCIVYADAYDIDTIALQIIELYYNGKRKDIIR